MLDDENVNEPLAGVQLLSYALGELDTDARDKLEQRLEEDPRLKSELEAIRGHMKIHQRVRKVAPRRGSFDRLRARMKKEGAFVGAIPGVHCMLRRSFMLAVLFGVIAVALLMAFGAQGGSVTAPDVIGQIVYHNPSLSVGQRRAEVDREELILKDEDDPPERTGSYDAFLWLPTGVSNTYSTIEAAQNTEFKFVAPRRVILTQGFLRRLQIEPGGFGEGDFIIETPHGRVRVRSGSLSVRVTGDGAETQVSVAQGSAHVFGRESDRAFQVPGGYCLVVERGELPSPARPMLRLELSARGDSRYQLQASLVNQGYVPVRIRRAIDSENVFPDPIYTLHISHVAEFKPGERAPENTTLGAWPVTPEVDVGQDSRDHMGETELEPGQAYSFRFDISPSLIGTPNVEHWLRLVYQGDLYGPPGEARVRIESRNLKRDLRNR